MLAWTEDSLGNQTATVDFGEPGVDAPIRTETAWQLPPGDTTGWSYRPATKSTGYATDSSGTTLQAPPARSYAYSYTSAGLLLAQTASLPNEPPPMSAASGFAAGAPPDATTSSTVCIVGCTSGGVTGIQYDPYGNAITTPRANGRCTGVAYDALFAQLPQATFAYQSGCGSTSPPPLQTTTIFDRGLEQPTQKSAPFSDTVPLLTATRYDAFGRVVEVDPPSADVPGLVDTAHPSLLVRYLDATQWSGVRAVASTTADGAQHMRYVDGRGDALCAVDTGGGTNLWVVSGARLEYTNGRIRQTYLPYSVADLGLVFDPNGNYYFYSVIPGVAHATTFDGAGRVLTETDADGFTTTYAYAFGLPTAAMTATVRDPEQTSGGHVGAWSSTSTDGHGRVVSTDRHVERSASGAGDLVTTTTYAATGERTSITQTYPGGSYHRQMTYDALGRMVGQVEPNTGTWQYAYDDSGDLVGLMDARGCGKVVYHDGLGRVVAEDYSPCPTADAPAYSAPNLATGDGTEAFYAYDGYGNVAQLSDRAQQSTFYYDARNRLTSVQRKIAVPGGSPTLAARYAPQVYTRQVQAYDAMNRPVQWTTGTDLADLQVQGQSQVQASYDPRGSLVSVTSSYGTLIAQQQMDVANRLVQRTYGDPAGTSCGFAYDPGGRVRVYGCARSSGPWVGGYAQGNPPSAADFTTQGTLANVQVSYDKVGNPVSMQQPVTSNKKASEWPDGARAFHRRVLSYGDDYRLANMAVNYDRDRGAIGADDSGVDGNPYTDGEIASATYPALASTDSRVGSQTFGYDLRGNVLSSADDADDSWDRELGTVTYGAGTDRIVSTSGGAAITYDAAGNIATATTGTGTTFELLFDEVGRLARAVRQDASGTGVTEEYAYDAKGERVVTAVTPMGGAATSYTVQVFDSLVLKHASYPDAAGDYEHDDATENLYVNVGGATLGHVVYAPTLPSAAPVGSGSSSGSSGGGSSGGGGEPVRGLANGATAAATASPVHVFLTLPDPLRTTSFVIDLGTSELVEAISYQPYGGVDSDWRPPRWQSFREDVRFTGQWDNAEVGLVYMHARYYSPQLGRFVSPDPLTIQAAKGDLNPYAYALGSPFRIGDPTGLEPVATSSDCNNSACGDPQVSTSNPNDLASEEELDLLWTQRVVQEAQQAKFQELQEPAQAYEAAKAAQVVGALESLPGLGTAVGVAIASDPSWVRLPWNERFLGSFDPPQRSQGVG